MSASNNTEAPNVTVYTLTGESAAACLVLGSGFVQFLHLKVIFIIFKVKL